MNWHKVDDYPIWDRDIMQYMGGKSRISKYISEVLNNALSWRKEPYQQADCNGVELRNEREREYL